MVSLVDIVRQTRTVKIAAGEIELRGLGLRQIADLFLAFPSLRNISTEGAPDIGVVELIAQAPDAIATVIAESARQPEAVEAIADGVLTPDDVIECLTVIADLTFPQGARPFLERLWRLLGLRVAAKAGEDQGTSAPMVPSDSSLPVMMAAK
jgi:hypothetical protein